MVDLVRATGAAEAVKVKSIVTDEIGLNDALAAAGITAHETDLAELIVQLGHDRSRPQPACHDAQFGGDVRGRLPTAR